MSSKKSTGSARREKKAAPPDGCEPDVRLTYKLTLEYDGTHYHGWQRQPRLRTIQETLEAALARFAGHPIRVQGAGRTDAGVHAFGQVAHFQTSLAFPPFVWVRALNAFLPEDIAVLSAEEADPTFHSRFSAKLKTYRYIIYNAPLRSPLQRFHAWSLFKPLDLKKMRAAARKLSGPHDFTSFCAAASETENKQIDLKRIKIEKKGKQIQITFEASRFVQYMVRNIVGLLVEVGRGRRSAEEIPGIFKKRDRAAAGPTAPPHGLFLIKIEY